MIPICLTLFSAFTISLLVFSPPNNGWILFAEILVFLVTIAILTDFYNKEKTYEQRR